MQRVNGRKKLTCQVSSTGHPELSFGVGNPGRY